MWPLVSLERFRLVKQMVAGCLFPLMTLRLLGGPPLPPHRPRWTSWRGKDSRLGDLNPVLSCPFPRAIRCGFDKTEVSRAYLYLESQRKRLVIRCMSSIQIYFFMRQTFLKNWSVKIKLSEQVEPFLFVTCHFVHGSRGQMRVLHMSVFATAKVLDMQ